MDFKKLRNKKIGYGQLLAIGFLIVILFGAFMLCLPISNRSHTWNSFFGSLFTATSSTCVTGLVMYDTWTQYNLFGQIIILILIQLGGLGFMIPLAMLSMAMRKKMSTHSKKLLQQATGYFRLNGVKRMIKIIIFGTLIIEGCGALLLSFDFIPRYGFLKGVWYSIFHAISSFCNAGFDLMGSSGTQYASLSSFYNNPYVLIVLSLLIIIGGIGFLVWDDVIDYKWHFKEYEFHSKLVISTSIILIAIGTILYMVFEYNNPQTIGDMSFGLKLLNSFFQSVTTRTAGFNVLDQAKLTNGSYVLTLVLMLIGGGPCSTAGGIKTSTIAIVFLNAFAAARNKREVVAFKKSIDDETIKQASAIVIIYILFIIVSLMIIMPFMAKQGYDIYAGAYVVCSAVGTVGLARDVTATFGYLCQSILIILMYVGRIGGLTIAMFFKETAVEAPTKRPVGKVLIG